MRIKIEQWLFVPGAACHWSRMNNSATVVEVRIREKKGIILEPHHSGYFRTASCQRLSCSAHSFFSLSSCSLSYLPPVHSLSHEDRTDSPLSSPSLGRTAYQADRMGLALDKVSLVLCVPAAVSLQYVRLGLCFIQCRSRRLFVST